MSPRRLHKLRQRPQPVRPERSTNPVPQPEPLFMGGLFADQQARQAYDEGMRARQDKQRELDSRYEADQAAYQEAQRRYEQDKRRNARLEEGNRLVREREAMMRGLPKSVRNQAFTQEIGDRVVDASRSAQAGLGSAREFARNAAAIPGQVHPGVYLGAGAGGAAVLGGAGMLNAYSQLQEEELDRGVLPTTARATANALSGIGSVGGALFSGGVGTDPLAMARNNVMEAQNSLGSNRVLEAIVLDQMDPEVLEEVADFAFEEAVDRKAKELMTYGSMNAAGETVFMSARDAYSQARQIIELDQKY